MENENENEERNSGMAKDAECEGSDLDFVGFLEKREREESVGSCVGALRASSRDLGTMPLRGKRLRRVGTPGAGPSSAGGRRNGGLSDDDDFQ